MCVGMASTEIPPRERGREFLHKNVRLFLEICDFRRVAASLTAANVISVGDFQGLQACPQLKDAIMGSCMTGSYIGKVELL